MKSNVYSPTSRVFRLRQGSGGHVGLRSVVCSCEAHVRETRRVVRSAVYGGTLPVAHRPLSSVQRGFTLIELLVAMAILMIIVLMLSNLFQQSTRAWDTGMRQTEVGLQARAAIHMIQRELSGAIYTSSGNFQVVNDEGNLETITPWADTDFGAPAPVAGHDDLFEISWSAPVSLSGASRVRVYAEGRESGDVGPGDVVDTNAQ